MDSDSEPVKTSLPLRGQFSPPMYITLTTSLITHNWRKIPSTELISHCS